MPTERNRPWPRRPALPTARQGVGRPGRAWRGGGLWLRRGRVEKVLRSRAELARLARRESLAPDDLGAAVLAPGFVDAHAHLELSALAGRLSGSGDFAAWIAAL